MTIAHTHHTISVSTNTELINLIKNKQLAHTLPHLMTADQQTCGRGQHNRSWLSPIGNVYLSFYMPIQAYYQEGLHRLTGALSLCVGLSLFQLEIIQQLNHERQKLALPIIQVKWANDLGLYHSNTHLFNKLAGILIEPVPLDNKLCGIVIGVGLNINNTPIIKDGLYSAISIHDLIDELGHGSFKKPAANELYLPILSALIHAIHTHNQYTKNCAYGIELGDDFINKFNAAHALTDKQVGIFEQDAMNTPNQTGICVGIDKDGTLLLKDNGKIQKAFAGMAKVI